MSKPPSVITNVPGPVEFYTPDGRKVSLGGYNFSTSAQTIQLNNAKPIQGDTEPIRQVINLLNFQDQQLANYNRNLVNDNGIKLSFGAAPSSLSGNERTSDTSFRTMSRIQSNTSDSLGASEIKAKQNRELNRCIESTLASQQNTAADMGQQLLNNLIPQLLSKALEFLNSQLPSQARLTAQTTTNEDGTLSVGGFGIGNLSINATNGEVILNGQPYDTALNGGLDLVNSLLPAYFQLTVSDLGITTSTDSISLTQLASGATELSNGMVASINADNVINIRVGSTNLPIARVTGNISQNLVTKVTTVGLSQLNRALPDNLQVYNTGDILQVGPARFDLANGGVSVNASIVEEPISSVINQLPAPLSAVARAAWEKVDLKKLLPGVFGTSEPIEPANDSQQTINVNASECIAPASSIPPLVITGITEPVSKSPVPPLVIQDVPIDNPNSNAA